MSRPYVTILGKTVRSLARLRGGGSALPGLFVERIDPEFISRTLAQLPRGVVIVSGTNGKTTTTKMVVELLEAHGLRVFTNRTGSNFTRGVAAALLGDIDMKGRLQADIAVLELDEAHAVHFVRTVKPDYSLLLNVMRDQLDRFGEIDTTARLLQTIADATSRGVAINREDPRLVSLPAKLNQSLAVSYFGLSEHTRPHFPSDDELRAGASDTRRLQTADVVLDKLDGQSARFLVGNRELAVTLKLQGIYNIYNAAAAVSFVRLILDDEFSLDTTRQALATITPAFGRGEILTVGGQPCELVLVKNPGGFRLGLKSFDAEGWATMIAINDNYADGRDMSWLWDVDFESLRPAGVAMVSGVRGYDMALRLQYDAVDIAKVELDLKQALAKFIAAYPTTPKRIYCTYTAMLALRRELGKRTNVKEVA